MRTSSSHVPFGGAVTPAPLATGAFRNTVPDIADRLKPTVAAPGHKTGIAMPSPASRVIAPPTG